MTQFWTDIENNLKKEPLNVTELRNLLDMIDLEFTHYFSQLFPSSLPILLFQDLEKNKEAGDQGIITEDELTLPLVELIKKAYPRKKDNNRNQAIIDTFIRFTDHYTANDQPIEKIEVAKILTGIQVVNAINALYNQMNKLAEIKKDFEVGVSELDMEDITAFENTLNSYKDNLIDNLKDSGITEREQYNKGFFTRLFDELRKLTGYVEQPPLNPLSQVAIDPEANDNPSSAMSVKKSNG